MSRKLYFLFIHIVARRCRHLTTHFTVSWTEFFISSTEEFNFTQLTVGQDKLWKTQIPFNSSLKFAVFVIHLLWCTRIFACKHQHDITCRVSTSSPKKRWLNTRPAQGAINSTLRHLTDRSTCGDPEKSRWVPCPLSYAVACLAWHRASLVADHAGFFSLSLFGWLNGLEPCTLTIDLKRGERKIN